MKQFRLNHFNFKRIDNEYFLTNDLGKSIFLSTEEFNALVKREIVVGSSLFSQLRDNYFVLPNETTENFEALIDSAARLMRENKSFLFEGTQLHIFVLTSSCNQNCVYCQVGKKGISPAVDVYMSAEVAQRAVDLALSSPSNRITIEFQGGEPLLNWQVLRFIVEYARLSNQKAGKNIVFNLVSNLTLLNDEILDFLITNDVSICTSLDGPEELHNYNRPYKKGNPYSIVTENIKKINSEYKRRGMDAKVQALQTTTKRSLFYAKEIINEYLELGINHLFIRPLTPLGFALTNWDRIGYAPEEFLVFYQEIFNYIMELRKQGMEITEGHLRIFSTKIFQTEPLNYMELRSPCGGAIGQLAYNYDGNVYTCDEGRMIAEIGDLSFLVGNVFENEYNDLVDNPVTHSVCTASCLESIPGCSDCVYNPYCGTCPVVNLKEQDSIFGKMPESYKCRIYKGMLDMIFHGLKEGKFNPYSACIISGTEE